MPTIYKTAQQYAEELQNPQLFEGAQQATTPAKSYPAGSEPRPSTPLTLSGPLPLSSLAIDANQPPEQPAAPQTQEATQAPNVANPYTAYRPKIPGTGAAPSFNLRNYVRNPGIGENYAGLFAPLTKGVEKTTEGLQTTAGQFGEAAGPGRTYEGIGAENILGQALTQGGDEAAAFDAAKSLIDARYTGPTGLDQDTLDALYGSIQNSGGLRDLAGSLRTGLGIQNAIRTRTPGLTHGELRAGARGLEKDTGFQASRRGIQQDIGELSANIGRTAEQAKQFGAERTAAEADIAQRSHDYVQSREDEISKTLADRVAAEVAYNQALQDAFDTFMKSGTVEDLGKVPGATDLEGFEGLKNDPYRAGAAAAQAAVDAINKDFEDIKDIPLMEAGASSRGYWNANMPAEWMANVGSKLPPEELARITARVQERQRRLNAAGLGGGFEGFSDKAKRGLLAEGAPAQSDLNVYKPAYDYGTDIGDYQVPELRDYVHLTAGVAPTKENLSTEGERFTYNRAAELLGDAGNRLEKAETPYEKKKIVGEITRLLDEEAKQYEERKAALSQGEQEYLDWVHKTRKDFRKLQRKKKYAKIARILNDITLFVVAGPAGPAIYESGRSSKSPVSKYVKETEKGQGNLASGIAP